MPPIVRKKGLPTPLHISPQPQITHIALAAVLSPHEALSAASDSDSSPSPNYSSSNMRPPRNMKRLSITLPSAHSSSTSICTPPEPQSTVDNTPHDLPRVERVRRPSVISLPATNPTSSILHRKEEDGSNTVPYADGPTQILPGIWLGSEENARDWKGLMERGIKSILNVAKEVSSPFDITSRPLRAVSSTPNFKKPWDIDSTYHPPHPATGRPGMHYLKLQWSHGQQDLVDGGFQSAMSFTDAAAKRGEGVLIHCQCGISRSATMVIALVMRAAAERSQSVPPEVWALKSMQDAYSFVKEKSAHIGPNMSLIYQLLEYEKKLKGDLNSSGTGSENSSILDEEEEWGRRRRMMDESPDDIDDERESNLVMQEARALDKAMEDRIVARKSSVSSLASSASGVGMGAAWRSRYGHPRKRTGSIASNVTNGSMLSEDLVEEDEEQELLGIGGGFDDEHHTSQIGNTDWTPESSPDDETEPLPEVEQLPHVAPRLSIPRPPPSAPSWKTSFKIPPPPSTAVRSTFNLPPRPPVKGKRRPPPIDILPPVPSSPVTLLVERDEPTRTKPQESVQAPHKRRVESKELSQPPLHLRNNLLRKGTTSSSSSVVSTPSQTLFVFPPSPTLSTRTPSTMTLTSNLSSSVPFPNLSTPRVSTFRSHGRTRSFIGLGSAATPTTAFSKVDVRGYVSLQ